MSLTLLRSWFRLMAVMPRRRTVHAGLKSGVTIAVLSIGTACSAEAADKMAADGLGCKDRSVAGQLIDMPDTDPAYVDIWAKGMQDLSCRGLSGGDEVAVKDRDDDMTCVLPLNDSTFGDGDCFWVVNAIAPLQ